MSEIVLIDSEVSKMRASNAGSCATTALADLETRNPKVIWEEAASLYVTVCHPISPTKIANSRVLNSGVTGPNLPTYLTEMIADFSAEIKIAIFQSVSERQRDQRRSSYNCGRIAEKKCAF